MNNAIEQYWDYETNQAIREVIFKQCRWVTARGTFSSTGRSILGSCWGDLTPSAQRVIARVCGLENY